MTESRRGEVVHFVGKVGEPSQIWIADLINGADRYRPSVVCERVVAPVLRDEVPVIPGLPSQTPGLPFRLERAWERLDVVPLNPWRRALPKLAPAHDVVHAHFGPYGWRCVHAGLSRVVTTFYGYDVGRLPRERAWRRAYSTLFRSGSAFLAEGPAMCRRLVEIGAPEGRVRLQPLIAAVEVDAPPPPPRLHGPLVVMTGRFVEKKGFADGVRAFAAVARRHPDARLLLVGDGPERRAIEEAVAVGHLWDRVEIRPFLSREDYRAIVADASVMLQPSRTASDGDTEGGAPTTLLDAQALGTVVVATRHADIPFVVDEQAAFLSDEHDPDDLVASLDTALAERDSWADRATRGFEHVCRQHARAAVIARLEAVYDEVRHGG